MSNSVRNLGSSLGTDISRFGAGPQPDPASLDAEFSTVMNAMLGATDGAGAANEGGANTESDTGGQDGRQLGPPSPGDGRALTAAARSLEGVFAASARVGTGERQAAKPVDLGAAAIGTIVQALPADSGSRQDVSPVPPAQGDAPAQLLETGQPQDRSIAAGVLPQSGLIGNLTIAQQRPVASIVADQQSEEPTSIDRGSVVPSRHGEHDPRLKSTASPATSGANRDDPPAASSPNSPISQQDRPFAMAQLPMAQAEAVLADSSTATLAPNGGMIAASAGGGMVTAQPLRRPLLFNRVGLQGSEDAGASAPTPSDVPTTASATASDEAAIAGVAPRQWSAISDDQRGDPGASDPISRQAAVDTSSATIGSPTAVAPNSLPLPPESPDRSASAGVSPIAAPTAQLQPLVAGAMISARDNLRPDDQPAPAAVEGVAGTISINPSDAPSGTATDFGSPPPGLSGSFADALANHVMSLVSNGGHEVTLQLQPPQLGEMTIRVAVQGRDVSTWFGAAQPQVQLAVSQALDQLRTDLAGAGLNLAGAWVGTDASTMRRAPYEAATPPPRRNGFVAAIENSSIGGGEANKQPSGVSVYA